MDSTWNELFTQIVTIVAGLLFAGVSTLGGFYIKRLTDNIKRKTLLDEINRYAQWAEEVPSFKLMSNEEKKDTVLQKAQEFALENGINLSEKEIALMVERAVNAHKKLENIGLKLMTINKIKLEGEN